MKIIMETIFGSKLYGLDNPNSDTDIKGIYIPELKDLLLGTYKPFINMDSNKSGKNNKDSTDKEYIALPDFIKMCMKNETVAFDMLHSHLVNKDNEYGFIWSSIQYNKHRLLTKNMKAHLGFINGQIKRFNRKGDKLKVIVNLIKLLKSFNGNDRLSEHWGRLPTGKYLSKGEFDKQERVNKRYWDVFGSKYQENITIRYCIEQLQLRENSYGKRSKKTLDTDSIDVKAVSHGFRVGYQLKELYETGSFSYPLKESQFLRDVKDNKFDYHLELAPKLKDLLNEVGLLGSKSNYPERCDKEYWDNWLIGVYKEVYGINN